MKKVSTFQRYCRVDRCMCREEADQKKLLETASQEVLSPNYAGTPRVRLLGSCDWSCHFSVCLWLMLGTGAGLPYFWSPQVCWSSGMLSSVQFSSITRVRLFVTPWTAACQASLSITNFWSLLKPMSIESVMPSNHLILCCPLLLPPSIFLSWAIH